MLTNSAHFEIVLPHHLRNLQKGISHSCRSRLLMFCHFAGYLPHHHKINKFEQRVSQTLQRGFANDSNRPPWSPAAVSQEPAQRNKSLNKPEKKAPRSLAILHSLLMHHRHVHTAISSRSIPQATSCSEADILKNG